jgi:hypothetical protein
MKLTGLLPSSNGGTGIYQGASGGGPGDIWLYSDAARLGGSLVFKFTVTMVA